MDGFILLDSAPDAKWQASFAKVVKVNPIPELAALQEKYKNDPCNINLKALTAASAPHLFTHQGQSESIKLLLSLPYNTESCQWSEKHFDRTFKAKWVPETTPTLILAGEEDLVTPLRLFREDKRFCRSNIILKSIKEAGHFLWIENPTGVVKEFDIYAGRLYQ